MFGKIENPKNEHLADLSHREFATFAPLLILAVWMGIYPAPFLRRLENVGAAHHPAGEPAVRGEVRRVQHRAADRGADRRVEQPGGEVPVDDAVRHQRQPASVDRRRAGQALMPPGVSLSDFYYILPELVLTGGALLVLIADVLLPKDSAARRWPG